MSLRPDSSGDGPVNVHLEDGNVLRYDRLFHHQSGMVTLYEVREVDGTNHTTKGERAVTIPTDRIEEIEWTAFGPE